MYTHYLISNSIVRMRWFYLQIARHFCRELEERRRRHAAIDPLHQDSGPDGLSHRTEFRLLLARLAVAADLARKGRRQPGPHFRRHRVSPHFRQIVVIVRRPSAFVFLLFISIINHNDI